MTARQLLRLAVVLGGLLLLWGAVALTRRHSDEATSGWRRLASDTTAVDSVAVRSATDTVVLARAGTTWRVNGFAAGPDEVTELLSALADTAQGELVAESPGSHTRLGVDSVGARRVQVIGDGKAVLDVLVGGSESGSGTGYLRRVGEPKVYRIRTNLAELAARKADDWRDKTIVSLPADSIGSIAVRRGRAEYALRREGKQWKFGSGVAADSAKAANLAGELARIQAAAFATPAQAASLRFSQPDRRLTLTTASGRTLAALLFDSTGSGIWVRHDTSGRQGTIWRVESWDWDRIIPEKKSLE